MVYAQDVRVTSLSLHLISKKKLREDSTNKRRIRFWEDREVPQIAYNW